MIAEADLTDAGSLLDLTAQRVADIGAAIKLPDIAVSADISSTEPVCNSNGRPYAETLFRWVDPDLKYWHDHSFALRAPFVMALRCTAEPFYFHENRFASWRPSPCLAAIDVQKSAETAVVGSAIIVPVYLPAGVVGGVVWATRERLPDTPTIYARWAGELHNIALRFLALCQDRSSPSTEPAHLTRREVQCLKWAASGKTDVEIGEIVHISMPTVRFHIRNAAAKLGAPGRAQAIHKASTLGYIGRIPSLHRTA